MAHVRRAGEASASLHRTSLSHAQTDEGLHLVRRNEPVLLAVDEELGSWRVRFDAEELREQANRRWRCANR